MNTKNIPISEEKFCKIINFIAERQKGASKIIELFAEEFQDAFFDPYSKYDVVLVDLLETIFDDKETDWIGYYLYELDCGTKWHPGCVTEDDVDVPLSNAKELYDLLVKNLLNRDA